MIFRLFKKHSITLLDEKWNIIQKNVRVDFLPRIHELVFIPEEEKYYRVVNVVYNLNKNIDTFVIIEQYTDDYKLMSEVEKK